MVTIIFSQWDKFRPGMANAVIEENGTTWNRDYCPTDSSKSYSVIRKAQDEGTLTGMTTPQPYPEPVVSLDDAKRVKDTAIEGKTDLILGAGITVQLYGTNYSMDTVGSRAQINWLKLAVLTILVLMGALPGNMFPQNIVDKNDQPISILTPQDAITFLLTMWLSENGILARGAQLRKQVKDATTIQEVNEVVDDR